VRAARQHEPRFVFMLVLIQGVSNFGVEVVAGLKPPFRCFPKKSAPSSGV
jgi:hypothetical protein